MAKEHAGHILLDHRDEDDDDLDEEGDEDENEEKGDFLFLQT